MPGAVVKSSDPPGVSLSFANNFWGKDDAGVPPLLERMHNAKLCCDELKTFYNIRAAIEEEYARKLLALSRKPLGSRETGSLRASLDTVKAETEALGKTHGAIAAQMKSELEEPLVAFAGGMKERRKIVQTGIEKLLKVKMQQTQAVNKTRDRFEQDCLRVKGYLAQGHMVMGQEERKNKAKLEKTQAQLAQNSHEYEIAVKTLEDTSGKWVKEWKVACDKFQDLEEERLDFTRSCLWNYANIASTACVSDDASCEKIRVALEECEVEKDIHTFIKEKGTGHEIPDPPKFVNFSRSDSLDDDDNSDAGSADDPGYSVAQFHRPIHSESSPAADAAKDDKEDPIGPSMSELSTGPGSGSPRKGAPADSAISRRDVRRAGRVPPGRPPGAAGGARALPPGQTPAPLDIRRPRQMVPDGMDSPIDKQSTSPTKKSPVNTDPIPAIAPVSAAVPAFSSTPISPSLPSPILPPPASSPQTKHPPLEPQRKGIFGGNSPFRRRSKHDKDRGSAPAVGGAAAAARSPTTQTQPQTQTRSPWNRPPPPGTRPLKGQSPITARHNTHDRHRSAPVAPAIAPPGPGLDDGNSPLASDVGPSAGPNEPVDPRANFQLNIGNNVFDVASPDQRLNQQQQQQQRGGGRQQQQQGSAVPTPGDPAVDPIAQALAELKGISSAGTSSSALGANGSANPAIGTGSAISRVSADQYVGLGANSSGAAASSSAGAGAGDGAILPPPPLAAARPGAGAGQSGTPPPAYDATPSSVSAPVVSSVQHQQPLAPVRRLDAPQPAFTSAQMQRTTQKYAGRTQGVFNRPLVSNGGPPGGGGGSAGRGTSPVPLQRSSRRRDASPGQASMRSGTSPRSVSPGPPGPRDAAAAAAAYQSSSTNSRHRYSQQNMPSNVPSNNNGPPRSLSYSPLPHQGAQQGSGSRYARHVSPGTSPSSSAALQRGGAPPASPRSYPSRVSPAGQGTIRGHPSQQQQHPGRGSYGRPLSDQIIRHDSGAAASAYSRPATRQSAYYDARDPSPGGAAGYGRPSSSTGMELQLSPRVRGSGDGFDEYGAAAAAPADEGYGSQRSYPYGSASDVRSVSRGSSYGGAGGGGSARGRDRSGSRVMDGVSSDGRPILHYARALYPYVPAIPEEIGFARGDVLAILLHQDDGWWFAEMPDKPGYQGLVPSNYLAPIN